MTQIAWYLEGWEVDQDDFDDDNPKRCDTLMDKTPMPENPHRVTHAKERRYILQKAGLATYEINANDGAIVCLCCGMLSSNLHDIRFLYCGYCHEFHTERRIA